jgi:hypothetical protein
MATRKPASRDAGAFAPGIRVAFSSNHYDCGLNRGVVEQVEKPATPASPWSGKKLAALVACDHGPRVWIAVDLLAKPPANSPYERYVRDPHAVLASALEAPTVLEAMWILFDVHPTYGPDTGLPFTPDRPADLANVRLGRFDGALALPAARDLPKARTQVLALYRRFAEVKGAAANDENWHAATER